MEAFDEVCGDEKMDSGSSSPSKSFNNDNWIDDILDKLLSIRNKVPGPNCVIDLDIE